MASGDANKQMERDVCVCVRVCVGGMFFAGLRVLTTSK